MNAAHGLRSSRQYHHRISSFRTPRSGDPESMLISANKVPAFAGMTGLFQ
jgi:hypothetical protein